jgi:hypothetical protein
MQEFERLQRMIISGSLRTEKEAEFKLRCNVLRVIITTYNHFKIFGYTRSILVCSATQEYKENREYT